MDHFFSLFKTMPMKTSEPKTPVNDSDKKFKTDLSGFANSQHLIDDYFRSSNNIKDWPNLNAFFGYPNYKESEPPSNYSMFESINFSTELKFCDIRLFEETGKYLYSIIEEIHERLESNLSEPNTYKLSFKNGWETMHVSMGFNYIKMTIYSPHYGMPIILTITDKGRLIVIEAELMIAFV